MSKVKVKKTTKGTKSSKKGTGINGETKEFSFKAKAEEIGLSIKTQTVLEQQDLTSESTLSAFHQLAQPDDWKELGLTLGQEKLLKLSLEQWFQNPIEGAEGAHSSKSKTPSAQPGLIPDQASVKQPHGNEAPMQIPELDLTNEGKTFDEIFRLSSEFKNDSQAVKDPHVISSGYMGNDPRVLLTVKSSKVKTIHITQFISEKTKKKQKDRSKKDLVLHTDGPDQIILRADDSHPYKGLTVGEWGGANMRLLNFLLQEHRLNRDKIEFYMAYTSQIMDFLEIYEWDSILEFDFAYRELQAEHGFVWGTAIPQLESKILVSRKVVKYQNQNRSGPVAARNPKKKPDCRIFLAKGNCPFKENCNFNHPVTDKNESKND